MKLAPRISKACPFGIGAAILFALLGFSCAPKGAAAEDWAAFPPGGPWLKAAASGASAPTGSQSASAASARSGSGGLEFVFGNGTEPSSLDPSKIGGVPEHHIYMALFEGLVGYDPKTSLARPGLAESWKFSPNGLQLTFKLRKALWSDGTPITAQTVVDSWLRTLAPETAAEYAYMINLAVKGAEAFNQGKAPASQVGIRALSERSFQVDLAGPMPFAVDMMAHYAFAVMPMHLIKAKGMNWTKPGVMVSNGPYILKEWKPHERIVVERNPKYWDAASVALDRIVFLPIEDMLTAYNMYRAGDLDWASGVPLELIGEIKSRADYQVSPQVATYYYIFNVTRKPLDDVRVRKALAMALDKRVLAERVIKGGQLPTDALTPPMAGYEPPPGAAYDPAEARRLLADAGYPEGRGFPSIQLLYNTSEAHKKITEWVLDSWRKVLGITSIKARNIEWGTFLDTRQSTHDFDIARAGWIGDYLDPNTFLDMFLSDSGLNDGLYDNPEYDELVRKCNLMPAGTARFDTLRKAEEMLVRRDQAVLPLYYYVNQDLIDLSRWEGWYANPLGAHEWKYIRPKD